MATIREKAPYQWQVQIRRMGWPNQNATFRTKKDAEAWARKSEAEMDRGLFVDQSAGRETTLDDLVELYLTGVTAHRPSAHAQVAETARLRRFQREERALCSYAAVNLKPEPAVAGLPAFRYLHRPAPVAQLDRALPSEGRGQGFESLRARQSIKSMT